MAYICSNPDAWNQKPLVGDGQCVAFVKAAAMTPASSLWKEGDKVKGNTTIARGTAIATFENGTYPNRSTGNHAAIYLEQDKKLGILVYDQWATKPDKVVSKRRLTWGGRGSASNDGDRFSVIK
jgi:hypothetical protein